MSEDQSPVESKASKPVEEEAEESYSAVRWIITGILWFFVAVPGLASLLGFSGGTWWMNTLSNFRIQYVILFAVFLLIVAIFRRWVLALVCLVLLVLNFLPILPVFDSNIVSLTPQAAHTKIVLMNVAHKYNQEDYQTAGDFIMAEKPQLLLIQECDEGWLTKFYEYVRDDYAIVSQQPRGDHYGIALMARTSGTDNVQVLRSKTEKANWKHGGPTPLLHIPQTEAVIKIPGSDEQILFYGIRTRPPMSKARCDATEFIIDKCIARVNDDEYRDMPKIILGDMNHTVWSPYIKKLMNETGTTPNSGAYGSQTTWYAGVPWPLRLPIDMVLLSDDMNLYECRVGPSIKSTHFPLVITVGPGTHMQRKTETGISGMLQSAERMVEEQADKLKDAASERTHNVE